MTLIAIFKLWPKKRGYNILTWHIKQIPLFPMRSWLLSECCNETFQRASWFLVEEWSSILRRNRYLLCSFLSSVPSTGPTYLLKWINAALTLGTSSTHLHMPDSQLINIYHRDLILALISPTVKDTSKVRNAIHHFAPDVASAVGLLSRFIKNET